MNISTKNEQNTNMLNRLSQKHKNNSMKEGELSQQMVLQQLDNHNGKIKKQPGPNLTPYTKNNSKRIMGFNVKHTFKTSSQAWCHKPVVSATSETEMGGIP